MNRNLFTLAGEFTFSKGSKTAIILSEGSSKHSETELAKALLKTKAYKTTPGLARAVDSTLEAKVAEEKKEAVEPAEKSSTSRDGEPARRARGY